MALARDVASVPCGVSVSVRFGLRKIRNAAVAAALRPTDPALLHYRSGAFFLARGVLVDGREPLRDVLLGMVAATDEPISGGRHKVFGRHDLHIIPQTSTIASHLPRALGVAFSIAICETRPSHLLVAAAVPRGVAEVDSTGRWSDRGHRRCARSLNRQLQPSVSNVPKTLNHPDPP